MQALEPAIRALRRDASWTLLMTLAIGLGIGAAMTSATVLRAVAANPMAHKEGRLLNVQVDNWEPGSPYVEPGEPPKQLTYRDAVALWQAGKARRQTLMFVNELAVEPADASVRPFVATARFTTADFFPMFEPPFRYGGGWDAPADRTDTRVVVVSRALNERVFGGADSVGRRLRLGGEDFTVVGVLDEWHPVPRYYDTVNTDALAAPEDLYLPFRVGSRRELRSENNDCWPSFAGDYAAFMQSECVWMNLWIEVGAPAEAAQYRRFLDHYVMDQKQSGRFPQPLNNRLRTVAEWLAARHVVRADIGAQAWLSWAFLAVCLANTLGLLLARFLSRMKEISVHRALGASRRQVFARHLAEAGAIGMGGALLGLALTFGGTAAMRALDPTLAQASRLDAVMIAATIALALASALAVGAYPAWRACRTAPAAFLKSE